MLPAERLKYIKKLIRDKKYMKISDLSQALGVSEMTIHRDIKPLIETGIIIKTFGGIALAQDSIYDKNTCIYCNRNISDRLAYRIILTNHDIEIACCAHCGLLRHRQLGSYVRQSICYDFFKQTTISAPLASYVMDTSLDMGCCQPQVLTFKRYDHAEKFVKGFGGHIYSFQQAIEVISEKMEDYNV